MIIKGIILAESPIYRGNAKKTLFTRDGDGTHRLVSLSGSIEGTAQALMDAFVGQSKNGKNIGLLNRMWLRFYGKPMPEGLITKVSCQLQPQSYTDGHFFDLRMGMRLDEDRWAVESNANYKLETVMRKSVFDFTMTVNDKLAADAGTGARLYYILQELIAGRFWFGAGKSKGLGRLRLEATLPIARPAAPPELSSRANHLCFQFQFSADNPVLVGWNWGRVEESGASVRAADGLTLVQAMRQMPAGIRKRLEVTLAGPILKPADWKAKFAQYVPKAASIWLLEKSAGKAEVFILTDAAYKKLAKGKTALAPKLLEALTPLLNQPFASQDEAGERISTAFGKKANMAKRVVESLERREAEQTTLDEKALLELAAAFHLPQSALAEITAGSGNEAQLTETLAKLMQPTIQDMQTQIDQHLHLLQSDAWIDGEIDNRQSHLQIKQMLMKGAISEHQWNNPHQPPSGVTAAAWREFLSSHERVQFRHILHAANLKKSITNDQNMIAFLQWYRDRARQELTQPHHIDFRAGGPHRREMSKAYGKPYDTMFMRMLSWSPSNQKEGAWEIYIPGSTIKGAFRRRAAQVVKTLMGETPQATELILRLFGAQSRSGLVYFSDAYLSDPENAEKTFCSMDGVRMDPMTAKPVETAKRDYLFAYGQHLQFAFRMDLQDVLQKDLPAINLLLHLMEDFKRGDIPLGGEKTNGMGWVQARLSHLEWRTAGGDAVTQALFDAADLKQQGLWKEIRLEGEAVSPLFQRLTNLTAGAGKAHPIPMSNVGFVSHRAFGGYCGQLMVEARVLTPLHVRESGSPSYTATLPEGPVHGFDAFSLTPPDAGNRPDQRAYALPALSIKGMVRHLYTIASNTVDVSKDIGRLNPTDSLFGWVGTGPDQAIMGRLVFDFAKFEAPSLEWFTAPYPYGSWRFRDGQWRQSAEKQIEMVQIAGRWRLFPHTPLAPSVRSMPDFAPDTVQASYFRAIMPGATARFGIRFWNLREEELQRLIWCVGLEPGMAHKMGHLRALGCGSLKLSILPESFLTDWDKRYAGPAGTAWQKPLDPAQWLKPAVVSHRDAVKQVMDAQHL